MEVPSLDSTPRPGMRGRVRQREAQLGGALVPVLSPTKRVGSSESSSRPEGGTWGAETDLEAGAHWQQGERAPRGLGTLGGKAPDGATCTCLRASSQVTRGRGRPSGSRDSVFKVRPSLGRLGPQETQESRGQPGSTAQHRS